MRVPLVLWLTLFVAGVLGEGSFRYRQPVPDEGLTCARPDEKGEAPKGYQVCHCNDEGKACGQEHRAGCKRHCKPKACDCCPV